MLLALLVTITALTLLLYYWLVNGGSPVPSAANWFVLVNGLLLIGTLQVLDVTDPIALRFAGAQVAGLLAFSSGGLLVNLATRSDPSRRISRFTAQALIWDLDGRPWYSVGLPLLLVSLAVCMAFAIALGYHVGLVQVMLVGIPASVDELQSVYSTLRTEAHYGGRYLYIGYVTQFKDFILPTVTLFVLVRAQVLGGRLRWLAVVLLVSTSLYFLTITGQRAPILVFALVLYLTASSRWAVASTERSRRRASLLVVGGAAAGALAMFAAVSAIREPGMGRDATSLLLDSIGSFWGRMAPDLAREKISLAHLMSDRPASWGGDWIAALATVMPGHEEGLATASHRLLYGSSRGAAGQLVWESLWMNFRWAGIVLGGLLLGIFLQVVTLRSWSGGRYASKHVILMYLGFQLGLMTDPYSLLNGGVLTLALLYLLYRSMRRTTQTS